MALPLLAAGALTGAGTGAAAGTAGAAGAGGMGSLIASGLGSAAASLFGGKGQSKAEKKAGEYAYLQYLQQRKDLKPWMQAGTQNLQTLQDLMKSGYFERPYEMQEDPGYQFRLQQGEQAINRGAAARGDFFSGRAGKELSRFGQGLAAQEYGAGYGRYRGELADRYGRLSGISEAGRSAAGGLGQAGMQAAQMQGQGGMYGAQSKASGYAGMANALTGGLQDYLTYKGTARKSGVNPSWGG